MSAVVVVAAGLMVGPTPADAAGVCTANVTFAYAPGLLGPLPAPTWVTGTVVLTCPVLSPDAGMWTLPFAGPGNDSCAIGTGIMAWGPGVGPPGATAAVGGFQYARGYAESMVLLGAITAPGGVRNFVAVVEWVPILLPGNCVTLPVTNAVATGVAVLA